MDFRPDGLADLQQNLLHGVAVDERKELTPAERLVIIAGSDLKKALHVRVFADVLIACGCFEEAAEIVRGLRHWRTLGDLAWVNGEFSRAEECYRNTIDPDDDRRKREPDWDRLIRLAFLRQEWSKLLQAFRDSDCAPGVGKGEVILKRTNCAGAPYFKMLAIAAVNLGFRTDATLATSVCEKTGMAPAEWTDMLAGVAIGNEREIESFASRSVPRVTKVASRSMAQALVDGDTDRVRKILHCIASSGELLASAKQLREDILRKGRVWAVDGFFDLVTCFQVDEACRTFLFEAMDRDWDVDNAPAENRVQLYSGHPIMNKRYFGRLLAARFQAGEGIRGADLVTGLFQAMWIPPQDGRDRKLEELFGFDQLASGRDWAEARLEDWLSREGAEPAKVFRENWAWEGGSRPDPRGAPEWRKLVKSAHAWLAQRWEDEIAHEQWLSEAQMFQLLKKAFRGHRVERHAQPLWLGSQHLDCFLPDLRLAVEYMGAQHYGPVEFFGGAEGYSRTLERDERKRRLCEAVGVRLAHVRFDEKLADRITEIKVVGLPAVGGNLEAEGSG